MRVKLIVPICLIIVLAAACNTGPDPDLSAWIELPEDGAQLPQLPINLHIVGLAHLGIDEFDLWINGQLLESFPPQQTGSTSGGPTKFFAEHLWYPPTTGIFVLAVRAHGGSGGISPLSQITIEIQPPTVQESSQIQAGIQDPPLLSTLPGPITPYSQEPGDQSGISPDVSSEEWLIATPSIPSFLIKSAKLHTCNEQVYVVSEVKNNGPYYFQWVYSSYVWYAGAPHYPFDWPEHWEDPWIFSGSECPVPSSGQPSFGPGTTAFIYMPITLVPIEEEFFVSLMMCTFNSIPDSCAEKTYEFTVDLWPSVDRLTLDLKELVLCWVGPGPYYEVVNSIPEGSSVELLGIGDVEGYLVVQEPKYQRPCWLRSESAEDVPEAVFRELTTFETPLLPEGVVSGRVFKDQDANGAFGGSDVGIPSARVSIAAGNCGNPGQAMTTTTNNDGWYSFSSVDPGPYCVYVAKPNTCQKFSTADSFAISVDWGSEVEKSFGLEGCR